MNSWFGHTVVVVLGTFWFCVRAEAVNVLDFAGPVAVRAVLRRTLDAFEGALNKREGERFVVQGFNHFLAVSPAFERIPEARQAEVQQRVLAHTRDYEDCIAKGPGTAEKVARFAGISTMSHNFHIVCGLVLKSRLEEEASAVLGIAAAGDAVAAAAAEGNARALSIWRSAVIYQPCYYKRSAEFTGYTIGGYGQGYCAKAGIKAHGNTAQGIAFADGCGWQINAWCQDKN